MSSAIATKIAMILTATMTAGNLGLRLGNRWDRASTKWPPPIAKHTDAIAVNAKKTLSAVSEDDLGK